jgi:AAA+ superfamily predicted ATPase
MIELYTVAFTVFTDTLVMCTHCSSYTLTDRKVRFSDVIGCDEAKFEVQQIVDSIKSPQKYTELGASIPRYAMCLSVSCAW